MKKRSKFKQNRLSTRNFFSLSNRKLFMIFYFKKHFSKKYLTLNGFQRNVFLRFLKLTSLRFLGFSKWTVVSYRGISYNQILSVIYSVFQYLYKIFRHHVWKISGTLQFWVWIGPNSQIWVKWAKFLVL